MACSLTSKGAIVVNKESDRLFAAEKLFMNQQTDFDGSLAYDAVSGPDGFVEAIPILMASASLAEIPAGLDVELTSPLAGSE